MRDALPAGTGPVAGPLLEATGLVRRFRGPAGEVEVLRGVDLAVERGEFVAVTGASGSGKSTLLHLLGALDTPTAGTVSMEGEDLSGLGDAARSRVRARRIGFVFQAFHLIPELSVAENVEVPLVYGGVAAPEARARASEALAAVGLAGRERQRPSTLSGGEMQRVAVARALAPRPHVVLADEPTGNLDAETGGAIVALLAAVPGPERALVLVTHDPAVAARADRRLQLVGGRLA